MVFMCPNIQAHYHEPVIYLIFGTPKIMNFPFGTNGKFIILGVPILKHIRVLKGPSQNIGIRVGDEGIILDAL